MLGIGVGLGMGLPGGGASDTTAPTLTIGLSDTAFKIGDTATVTFTFSEVPTGFTVDDVTAPNGSLSSFTVTGNPLIYTATFTPTNGVTDATNVITVGTNWTDAAGNPPAGATTSENYAVDTQAPTCTITASAATITAAAFTATFTFSEDVTGFVLGDITVSANASAGTFNAVSGSVYTAVITPSATGTVTVDVAGGVCIDAAGNNNEAATQFSVLYVAAQAWYDADDISTLWQLITQATQVTADGDVVGSITDKSGTGHHIAAAANNTTRPLYKTNQQNSKPGILADGSNDRMTTTLSTSSAWTFIICAKTIATITANGRAWNLGAASIVQIYDRNPNWGFFSPATDLGVTSRNTAIVTVKLTNDGQMNWKINNGAWSSNINPADFSAATALVLFSSADSAADFGNVDMFEYFAFNSALSDAAVAAIISYLNTKWAVF